MSNITALDQENRLRLTQSRFFLAFLLFGVFSQALPLLQLNMITRSSRLGQTWASWAIESFNKERTRAPQVVFLGSSLMLTPLNMADAQILNQTLDGSQHHESCYFSRLVRQWNGNDVRTFNFSLPGEMPSDAYLIADRLLCGKKKPHLLLYGVGPRDFMDNLLDSPATTDPYQCLSRLGSHQPDRSFFGPRWDQQVNYFLSTFVCIYNKKEAILERLKLAWTDILQKELPPPITKHIFTCQQVHALIPQYSPMEITAGESLFKPATEQDRNRFDNNLAEYRKRYGTLNWNTFLTQLIFFGKLLDTARARHIDTVIVAMPITSVNRNLIPSTSWTAYKCSLKVLTLSKQAKFIDLSATNQFTDSDFGDTVHLNTTGGIKLMQLLALNSLTPGPIVTFSRSKQALLPKLRKRIEL